MNQRSIFCLKAIEMSMEKDIVKLGLMFEGRLPQGKLETGDYNLFTYS